MKKILRNDYAYKLISRFISESDTVNILKLDDVVSQFELTNSYKPR